MPTVGVLALQGCVTPHLEKLQHLEVASLPVRSAGDLAKIDGLILPGGESTTMLHLMKRGDLFSALCTFCSDKPCWGVCAGAILLAKEVVNPEQDSFGVIDIRATRNFYGSQLDSFTAPVKTTFASNSEGISVDFIRAPKLEALKSNVAALAFHEGNPVMFEQDNVIVSSFHPELGESLEFHRYFLNKLELGSNH